jgi:hypothetical protein
VEELKKMLRPASTLFAAQAVRGKEIREKSKTAYSQLLDANLLVVGVVASDLLRMNGKVAELKGKSLESGALIAGFVVGVGICEKAIVEGYYLQASSLLRQELETIAALEEIKQGIRQNGKTPNVKHLPWSLPKLYGDLSAAAHAASHQILSSIVEHKDGISGAQDETIVWGMIPEFDKKLSRRLYALHVFLIIQLAIHLHDYHDEVYCSGLMDEEVKCLNLAIGLLVNEGCLELCE